jgi:peptide/nickel transport system ATP-binding protein
MAPSAVSEQGPRHGGIALRFVDLEVRIPSRGDPVHALRGVSLDVPAGQITALVGASGSGKSMLARAAVDALPPGAVATGRIVVAGRDHQLLARRHRRALLGTTVALASQDALSSLNPVRTIGSHFQETLRAHRRLDLWPRAAHRALTAAGMGNTTQTLGAYVFELSGGQAQRVGLALALLLDPAVVLADEITTALDVTTRRDVLERLNGLVTETGVGVLLITHDLDVAASWATRIVVLHDGSVVESAPAAQLIESPTHPRSQALVAARVHLIDATARHASLPRTSPGPPALEVTTVTRRYRRRAGHPVLAIDNVSLTVQPGESVAIVGESGSGKSTLVRCLAALEPPDSGTVTWSGITVHTLTRDELRRRRQHLQVVFQHPLACFDPRFSVERIMREPLENFPTEDSPGRVDELLAAVDIPTSLRLRRPTELSGGQRQRIAIARALAPRPTVLLCDEPVSSLDAELAASVVDLLGRLRRDLGLTLVFVTHDLALVPRVADRVVVMAAGRIVEETTATDLAAARHPATQRLLSALPEQLSRRSIQGSVR